MDFANIVKYISSKIVIVLIVYSVLVNTIYTRKLSKTQGNNWNYVKIHPKIWWNCVKYYGVLYGKSVKISPIYSWNCVKCTIFALTINYLGYGKATQKKS